MTHICNSTVRPLHIIQKNVTLQFKTSFIPMSARTYATVFSKTVMYASFATVFK